MANAYSEPILRELGEVARERGVGLLVFQERFTFENVSGEERPLATDLASTANLDGILVMPLAYGLSRHDMARYLARFRPLPICSIVDVADDTVSQVRVENESGLRDGITHLIQVHSLKRIAFVRGPVMSDEAETRYRVYCEVLEAHGIALDERLVCHGYYIIQSGIDAVRQLVDERGALPEAIVCANDGMALGVLQGLSVRGILVPDQVAVLGFDDVESARYLDPPLTTVRQPLTELGRTAFGLLLDQITGQRDAGDVVLPSQLVVRESCGCLAHRVLPTRPSSVPTQAVAGLNAMLRRAPKAIAELRAFLLSGVTSDAWAESLYRAFVDDIFGEEDAFLVELRALLDAMSAARGDVAAVHRVITALGSFVRKDLVPGSAEWQRADVLLHAGRVKISSVAQRTPSSHEVRLIDAAYRFTQVSNALSHVVDCAGMSRVLAEHLPGLGIKSWHVCQYEANVERSRLMAGFDDNGAFELPSTGLSFESRLLWPGHMPRAKLDGERLIAPLYGSDVALGFFVCAYGAAEGFVYENLRLQIVSVFARLHLVKELIAEVERRQAAERERLEKEMAIATAIQTGILPKRSRVPGLEIAGVMRPASEVGGDYYDVIPMERGCWIGIGDVAGHGLPTGLVMLMLQSLVSGLVRANPRGLPSEILPTINLVLYENIRERMGQSEFVTFCLARYDEDGGLTYAGAHEDFLVFRHATGESEWLATGGTWLGAIRDIRDVTSDTRARLEPGDVLVAYTDGIVEAMNQAGEVYSSERLAASLERVAKEPVEHIRDALLADVTAWMSSQADDLTVLVVRRTA